LHDFIGIADLLQFAAQVEKPRQIEFTEELACLLENAF
jgi:hypothetical protein